MLSTQTYQQVLGELNNATMWFNSIGIETKDSRLEKIIYYVDLMNRHYSDQTIDALVKKEGLLILRTALVESLSFTHIYKQFYSLKSHELPRRKLAEILMYVVSTSDTFKGLN